MAEPWFEPAMFGAWFGAIAGGGLGTLGGVLGAAAGILAPRGKGKRIILGGFVALLAVGIGMLSVGLYALVSGQPYGIWYGFMLGGVVLTATTGFVLPTIKSVYRQAEQRRIEAAGLRTG